MNLETGARQAIERICEVYGFTSRNQLAKHLGITNSSLGNRIMRDNFPADIAIRCVLETGASLHWLVTGEGATFDQYASDTIRIPSFELENAKLLKSSSVIFDKVLLPEYKGELQIISDGKNKYLVDISDYFIRDGKYLIEYSGTLSIKELIILPGNKIRIEWGKHPIDCNFEDLKILGKVLMIMVNEN